MPISAEVLEGRRRRLVTVAEDLIRERPDISFTMGELAQRAEVSPATPYNLIGTKLDILEQVVAAEFVRFSERLSTIRIEPSLAGLLLAMDAMAEHYLEDPDFYRGLYGAAFGEARSSLGQEMAVRGSSFWQPFVIRAREAGDLISITEPELFTNTFLRLLAGVTFGWSAENWSEQRYRFEHAYAGRLILTSMATPEIANGLRHELTSLIKEHKLAG